MPFIEIKNVKYTLNRKGTNIPILHGINMEINKGELVALLGPNGAGKTTLTKLIMGIIKTSSGEIVVDGKDIKSYKQYEIGNKIGYLFQNPAMQLFNANVRDELLFASKYNNTYTDETLKMCDKYIVEFGLEKIVKTPISQLSQGEKQRVAICTILMNKPDFMILDEPTKGLDLKRRREFIEVIKELHSKGIGMLIVSHDMKLIEELPFTTYHLKGGKVSCE